MVAPFSCWTQMYSTAIPTSCHGRAVNSALTSGELLPNPVQGGCHGEAAESAAIRASVAGETGIFCRVPGMSRPDLRVDPFQSGPPVPEPQRLLLIDPDPSFRRILREQLEQDGAWRVDEAAGLAAAAASPLPDMVVATITGRPARAALVRWRQAARTAPLVALVGAGGGDVEGASVTIRKPVRLSELLGAIAALRQWSSGPAPIVVPDGGRAAAAITRRLG